MSNNAYEIREYEFLVNYCSIPKPGNIRPHILTKRVKHYGIDKKLDSGLVLELEHLFQNRAIAEFIVARLEAEDAQV